MLGLIEIIIVMSFLSMTSQLHIISKRDVQTTTCGERRLRAADYPRPFTSPNFPKKFADQTQCSWLIRSAPGTRVKVFIQDFSLLSPDGGNTCIKQFVRFHDPYTNMFVGPFCGNTNISPIVSSANELRVWLESNTVGIKGNYRGFKMSYKETTEPTSESMKDPENLYRKLNTAKPQQMITMPTIVPTDNRVDVNNNAAIDAENQKLNQETSKRNSANENMDQMIKDMAKANILRTQKAIYKTPSPGLTNRVFRTNPRRSTKSPAYVPPQIPTNRHTDHEQSNSNSSNGEVIGGVVCALLLLLIIGVFIFFKLRKTKEDKNNKTKSISSSNDKVISTLPGVEKIAPIIVKDTLKNESEVKSKLINTKPKHEKICAANKKEQDTLNVLKNEAILPRDNKKRSHRHYEEINIVLQDKGKKKNTEMKSEEQLRSNKRKSDRTNRDHSKKKKVTKNKESKRNSRSKTRELPQKKKENRIAVEKPKKSSKRNENDIQRLPRRAENKSESNRDIRRHRSHSAEKRKKNAEIKKRSKSVNNRESKSKSRRETAVKNESKTREKRSVKTTTPRKKQSSKS